MAHYNIDEQIATLVNQFKIPADQHKLATKIQGHIYGMLPDAKTTHSVDKAGYLVLRTTMKIEEPSTAEMEHFYHQCDVIAAMVFIKPTATQEDIKMGQETTDFDGAEPPALSEPTEAIEDGENEPKAIDGGLNTAFKVDEDPDEQDDSPDDDGGNSEE